MKVEKQIEQQINSQSEPKRGEMETLHQRILQVLPTCKLWFFDGKNEEGKAIANPTIGYGFYTIKYANGSTRDFFQIGMSANKAGITINILGLEDKTYLAKTYGEKIGKASITGYCIKFKTLKDIDINVLEAAIRYGFAQNQ